MCARVQVAMHLLSWRPAPFRLTKFPVVGVGLIAQKRGFREPPLGCRLLTVCVWKTRTGSIFFLQCVAISRIGSFSINRT